MANMKIISMVAADQDRQDQLAREQHARVMAEADRANQRLDQGVHAVASTPRIPSAVAKPREAGEPLPPLEPMPPIGQTTPQTLQLQVDWLYQRTVTLADALMAMTNAQADATPKQEGEHPQTSG